MVTRYSIGEDFGLVEDPKGQPISVEADGGVHSNAAFRFPISGRDGKNHYHVGVAIIDDDGNLCNNKERKGAAHAVVLTTGCNAVNSIYIIHIQNK